MSATSSLPPALSPSPSVHFAAQADGAVLLDLAAGKFYGLNPTAAAIWKKIADGVPLTEIPHELAPALSVDEARMRRDTHRLVHALHAVGLLIPLDRTANRGRRR
ncbi:hypothetical protein HNR23_001378 [Nocardiopsis mwathae]|uniref:PqqD family protein n=1 Tax=Nocardiopsis mwathae TaxID=1472723 RepID=A0A7X0D4L6_9ACTN|nr:PqqD family protein [Nocardiopsis mwathae]MBB6171318.1 hypothetical protein [Nocardiopsis mwathae]